MIQQDKPSLAFRLCLAYHSFNLCPADFLMSFFLKKKRRISFFCIYK